MVGADCFDAAGTDFVDGATGSMDEQYGKPCGKEALEVVKQFAVVAEWDG